MRVPFAVLRLIAKRLRNESNQLARRMVNFRAYSLAGLHEQSSPVQQLSSQSEAQLLKGRTYKSPRSAKAFSTLAYTQLMGFPPERDIVIRVLSEVSSFIRLSASENLWSQSVVLADRITCCTLPISRLRSMSSIF